MIRAIEVPTDLHQTIVGQRVGRREDGTMPFHEEVEAAKLRGVRLATDQRGVVHATCPPSLFALCVDALLMEQELADCGFNTPFLLDANLPADCLRRAIAIARASAHQFALRDYAHLLSPATRELAVREDIGSCCEALEAALVATEFSLTSLSLNMETTDPATSVEWAPFLEPIAMLTNLSDLSLTITKSKFSKRGGRAAPGPELYALWDQVISDILVGTGPNLVSLDLTGIPLTSGGLAPVVGALPRLRRLKIHRSSRLRKDGVVDDLVIAATNLEELALPSFSVVSPAMREPSVVARLRVIDLHLDQFHVLADHARLLEVLCVHYASKDHPLSDEGIGHLAEIVRSNATQLRKIELSHARNTAIPVMSYDPLVAAIAACSVMEEVKLGDGSISLESWQTHMLNLPATLTTMEIGSVLPDPTLYLDLLRSCPVLRQVCLKGQSLPIDVIYGAFQGWPRVSHWILGATSIKFMWRQMEVIGGDDSDGGSGEGDGGTGTAVASTTGLNLVMDAEVEDLMDELFALGEANSDGATSSLPAQAPLPPRRTRVTWMGPFLYLLDLGGDLTTPPRRLIHTENPSGDPTVDILLARDNLLE